MLSWSMLEGDAGGANNDLRSLEDMFPDVDHAVINDVYGACDQDVQRSMQALWGMAGGVSSEDMPYMNNTDSPYDGAPGYDSDFMLGNMSIAEWTSKLESISWQDAVRAVTGTLATVGTNVTQGLTSLAENLSTWVADLSTGGDDELDEDGRRRASGSGAFGDGPPEPQGMQRSVAARAVGGDGSVVMRRHERVNDYASSSRGGLTSSGRSGGPAKKDD